MVLLSTGNTYHIHTISLYGKILVISITIMDSFRGDGLNLYAYVANNPINYIDPTGYCGEDVNNSSSEKSWYENLWEDIKTGVSNGNQLIFTTISAPGNVLRTVIMDTVNGNFADISSNAWNALIGVKTTSVMDLALTNEQKQKLYEFSPNVYQFSDLALGTLDPVELYGLGKSIGALNKAPSLYDDVIRNTSDDIIKNTGDDVIKNVGDDWVTLGKKNKKHILAHTVDSIKNQLPHLTDDQLVAKLNKDSFFNPKWTNEQILNAVEEGFNYLRSKGLTGLQYYEAYGEKFRIFIKSDGTFDSAYGLYKFTKDYFTK